ncbi:uncharacterized protein DMENIID0001_087390 [Sergentomyia squamirostris]
MELKIICLGLALIVLLAATGSMAGVSGDCPLSSKMSSCSPKCKDDTECSTLGGKCCHNICNTRSCVLPGSAGSRDSSAGGYKGSSSGAGTYCGNVKCNSGEKCDFDKSSKRQKCDAVKLEDAFLRDLEALEESALVEEEEKKYREFLSSRQQSGFIPLIPLTGVDESVIFPEPTKEEEKLEEARNAHYSFSESVQDTINDQAIERVEEREGLKLKGLYSYSDGFFKRTVHYEADENGYRVINEVMEPIGDGPQYNPKGQATVETSLTGRYSITEGDSARRQKQQKSEEERL